MLCLFNSFMVSRQVGVTPFTHLTRQKSGCIYLVHLYLYRSRVCFYFSKFYVHVVGGCIMNVQIEDTLYKCVCVSVDVCVCMCMLHYQGLRSIA